MKLDEAEIEEIRDWYEHALSNTATASHFMFTNESYLKSFWQNTNHGIIILDQDYNIIDANPFICELVKSTKAELMTKSARDILAEQFIQEDYINISSVIMGKQYSFKKDTKIKEKFANINLIPCRIVATRIPSSLTEAFKYVIIHIYPQPNVFLSYKKDGRDIYQGQYSQPLSILKSIIDSKWFGWVITLIIFLTAISGQLGQLLAKLIYKLF